MSNQNIQDSSTPSHKSASNSGESSTTNPSPTPSDTPSRSSVTMSQLREITSPDVEESQKEQTQTTPPETESVKPVEAEKPAPTEGQDEEMGSNTRTTKKKTKCRRVHKIKDEQSKKASSKTPVKDESSSSESDEEESSSSDDTSSDGDDESEDQSTKKKSKSKRAKKSKKTTKRRKANQDESDDDDSEDDESDESPRKKKSKKSAKKSAKDKKRKKGKKDSESEESGSEDSDASEDEEDSTDLRAQVEEIKLQLTQLEKRQRRQSISSRGKSPKGKKKGSKKKLSAPSYQRVDQLWDSDSHDYKLKESAEADESEFAEHAFLVRRCFNWENRYTETVIDIKSKQLRSILSDVLVNCKSVTLEAEEPTIDPNILFLYLEELRTHYKKTLKAKIKAAKKQKTIKKLSYQKSVCKLLVKYIDEDYASIKKTLYPLLEAGNITFDLLWALYKPNEIAITSCYGSWEEPRCFKVDYANKFSTMARGEWYCVEGRYLEYDGKSFGFADFETDVESFKGPRKISSLSTYPLKYHRDLEGIKKKIIERGQQFVDMEGMQYKSMKGMAFMKKRKQIAKININGRVMVDPSTFRRVQPNYAVGGIRLNDSEELFSEDEYSDSDCGCCDSENEGGSGGSGGQKGLQQFDPGESAPKYKYKWVDDKEGRTHYVRVEVDEHGDPIRSNRVEKFMQVDGKQSFSKEELLLASPVVLGFAFSEKLWLEFSISGLNEIVWNEGAFDSLVLPPNQKQLVRALVESHKSYGAKAIDDVVVGKGQALNCVLHGPPGVGKTLTAESMSELLHCPLYMVSAGELGVDPGKLEYTLQQILDIAHSWGAILLIDEADVFLEARELHDLQRNALVSIFLRLLEYYQGILILTTNRVNTFDDALTSRIHIALRYEELSKAARLTVWKTFIDMVHKNEGATAVPVAASDLESLSRHSLNGRQIKNLVKSAQSLALFEKKPMVIEHIRRVLDVAETFDRDLKGGTGYVDAMRSYT